MTKTSLLAAALAASLLLPASVRAQGVVQGANQGAAAGERVGGPVGGVVGSVIGGVVGGVNGAVDGILGRDTRPRFREYVIRENRPSYVYTNELRPGVILPQDGPAVYDAPDEFGLKTYRYTVVNGRVVVVDPATRRIVDIVE